MMYQQIVQVNGENGAKTYSLAPNSSAILLDMNNPCIWVVSTDGAGYKTVSCYDITPHKDPDKIELSDVMERLSRIEERLNESNTESNTTNKRKKSESVADDT